MKQIPAPLLTLLAGVLITLASLWVSQNDSFLLPEQASEQAPLVDNLFNAMMVISVALFIVVEGTIVYFFIRFRKPKDDETDGIPLEGNLPLEAFWTAIPAIIVIGLSIYSVDVFQQMGAADPGEHGAMAHGHHHKSTLIAQAPGQAPVAGDIAPLLPNDAALTDTAKVATTYGVGAPAEESTAADLVVNVKGIQYAWLFNYPNEGIMTGELHVPIGKSVRLQLSAGDVIHSFWIPQFRMKQDAIPGLDTQLRFVATKTGTFPIVCTELCGSYHGGMRSQIIIHSPEEYDEWVSKNRVAQTPAVEAVSVAHAPVNTTQQNLTDSKFLAPYADEMGITAEAIASLRQEG